VEQFPSPNKHQQTDSSIQEVEINGMEWESDSELYKSRAEVGAIKTGSSDEGNKRTPTDKTRCIGEQHMENAGIERDKQAIHCKINNFNSRIS
jgi:hypothetical protein